MSADSWHLWLLVPLGYLIGSIPFGLIMGRLFGNVDVREHGSGKTGMTNVLRTAGAWAAGAALLLDMGKGAAAIVLARMLDAGHLIEAAAALAAIAGHNWSALIRFGGGRGTATGWGGLLVLYWPAGLFATLVGIPAAALTRYMSVGSIAGAALGSIALIVLAALGYAPLAYSWYGVIGGTLIVARHHDNIRRLIDGSERKIGESES